MKIADGAGNGLVVVADAYNIGDNLDLNGKISKLAELTVTSKVKNKSHFLIHHYLQC